MYTFNPDEPRDVKQHRIDDVKLQNSVEITMSEEDKTLPAMYDSAFERWRTLENGL